MSTDAYALAGSAADAIRQRLGEHRAALVLGSGWADVVGLMGQVRGEVSMPHLPGFPAPRVQGHSGMAHSVMVGDVPVLVMAGRAHLYERHPVETVVHGVRAAVMAGCGVVMLTNAAGSLQPDHGPGTPVLISDHLNLTGVNPLTGEDPPPGLPPRFADLSHLYSPRLRAAVRARFPEVPEGVYAGMLGGTYETPAEIRMLRVLGADLVGMSTVLEAIAAHHLGAEVFGLSLVTNLAAGLPSEPLDHHEVLAAGRAAVGRLAELLRAVVEAL
ncbi:MAG: purine-nucleoside phosphorylase [Thermoleophilia bacterium]